MKRVTNKRPPRVELRAGRRRQTRKTSSAASRPGAHAGPHSAGRRSRSGHAAAAAQPVATQQRPDPQYVAAVKHFEIATRFFNRGSFRKAKAIFEKLATNVFPEVADRAKLHLRLCDQKMARSVPSPKTLQECYALGVAELNNRDLDAAIEHLSKADKMRPKSEHVRYALAAAYALQGNTEAALEHLKVAIQLRPGNMYLARHDEDFQSLLSHPVFRSLVRADGGRAAASASAS